MSRGSTMERETNGNNPMMRKIHGGSGNVTLHRARPKKYKRKKKHNLELIRELQVNK